MKIILWIAIPVLILVAGFFAFNAYIYNEKQGTDTATATPEEASIDVSETAAPSSATATYTDAMFGFSFEYPERFSKESWEPIWVSKKAYEEWRDDPNRVRGGVGVNNIVAFNGDGVSIRVAVAPLEYQYAYSDVDDPSTLQAPPGPQEITVVDDIKVHRSGNSTKTQLLWQNSRKSALGGYLWNSIEITTQDNSAEEVAASILKSLKIQ